MNRRLVGLVALGAAALLGVLLVVSGARFLLSPEAAEQAFGLRFEESGDYVFHVATGVRNLFAGAVVLVFAVLRQPRALALVLACNALVPLGDMLVVVAHPNAVPGAAWVHGAALAVTLVLVAALVVGSTSSAPARDKSTRAVAELRG